MTIAFQGIQQQSPLSGLSEAAAVIAQALMGRNQQQEYQQQMRMLAQLMNPGVNQAPQLRMSSGPGGDIIDMVTNPAAGAGMTRDELLSRAIGAGITNPQALQSLTAIAQGYPQRATPLPAGKTRSIDRGGQKVTQEWDGAKWVQVATAPRWQGRQAGEIRTIQRGGQKVTQEWDGAKWATIGEGPAFRPNQPREFQTWQRPDGTLINLRKGQQPPAGAKPYDASAGSLTATQNQRLRTAVAKRFGMNEFAGIDDTTAAKIDRAVVRARELMGEGLNMDQAILQARQEINAGAALGDVTPPAKQPITNRRIGYNQATTKVQEAIRAGADPTGAAQALASQGWVQAGENGMPVYDDIVKVLQQAGVDPAEVLWPEDIRQAVMDGTMTEQDALPLLQAWGFQ